MTNTEEIGSDQPTLQNRNHEHLVCRVNREFTEIVIRLYFLAILPSAISVSDAMMKIAPAMTLPMFR
jgi:hypothetical protein